MLQLRPRNIVSYNSLTESVTTYPLYPLDGPLPDIPEEIANKGHQSRTQLIVELARRDNLTIRKLLLRLAGGRGHHTIAGTPKQIADRMEAWFRGGAADGFNVMPQLMGGGLEDFLDYVVPELRRRGLFRKQYAGTTLREHYGLPRPESQFARIKGITSGAMKG